MVILQMARIDKFKPNVNPQNMYSLLQFASHYRKFVLTFSKIVCPFRDLVSSKMKFEWILEHPAIVDNLKPTLKSTFVSSMLRFVLDAQHKFTLTSAKQD
ncbi:hypothetical protein HPB50_016275 [Hyalomma asiaticum]|uniref:Uncharacterized protein n=1 Tax=Hyalomma asiaticum TaxID=266040 RepID=A0ACB7SHL4_HYAAI|nr:hypothetical protein HPB50_016275 [Hyalomma asiaticum]